MNTLTPFLMFTGQARQAMALYERSFAAYAVLQCEEYPDDDPRLKGKIHYAVISIFDQQLAVIDSPVDHAFDFTPSLSLMVELTAPKAIRQAYDSLTQGGEILMPLDTYDFASQYAWINDPFGVSWQLKIP